MYIPPKRALHRGSALSSFSPGGTYTKDIDPVGYTLDQYTVDGTGTFLFSELERLDPTLHDPLVAVTWDKDIDLREDVTIADEQSSYTNSTFAANGGVNPAGKNWISRETNTLPGIALDIGKTLHPLYLWGTELRWTVVELAQSQRLGRPIDTEKYRGMRLKWNMDIDEQVYIGDTFLNVPGLVNNTAQVTPTNVVNGAAGSPLWTSKTPQEILNDVNTILTNTWTASAFARVPTKLLLPPISFAYLVNTIVSTAGQQSLLSYLRDNTIAMAANGKPLEIVPRKWLTGRGVGGTNRMVAYTQEKDLVRFPMVPLQRTPLEYRSMFQLTSYYGRLGVMEFVYPETLGYQDGF